MKPAILGLVCLLLGHACCSSIPAVTEKALSSALPLFGKRVYGVNGTFVTSNSYGIADLQNFVFVDGNPAYCSAKDGVGAYVMLTASGKSIYTTHPCQSISFDGGYVYVVVNTTGRLHRYLKTGQSSPMPTTQLPVSTASSLVADGNLFYTLKDSSNVTTVSLSSGTVQSYKTEYRTPLLFRWSNRVCVYDPLIEYLFSAQCYSI